MRTRLVAVLVLLSLAASSLSAQDDPVLISRARAIHDRVIAPRGC